LLETIKDVTDEVVAQLRVDGVQVFPGAVETG
jgi:hypothetical protein